MSYPRIIAHRCGGALAPENTLAGLRIAARLGCHGVEFDVMLGADGTPLLIHDETLERTTTGCGRVADFRSATREQIDAGIKHHRAFSGEPLPTLVEALDLCVQLQLWANVEIKPSAGCDSETGRVVARVAGSYGNVLLSSFSTEALRQAAGEAQHLPRALLVDALAQDWLQSVTELGACGLHIPAQRATEELLRSAQEAGIIVAAYTVNRRDQAERLFAAGITSVFTDRPDHWLAGEM